MKNNLKLLERIGAYILVVTLFVGMIPISHISAQAGNKEGFSVTGFAQVVNDNTSGAWKIWMTSDGTLSGQNGEEYIWPATLNSEDVNIQVLKDGGMFFVNIWSSMLPIDGTAEATLVLKKGTVEGSQGSSVTLTEDVMLCFNRYGLSMNTPIEIDTESVEFEVVQTYSKKTQIYLSPSKTDAFSETVDVRPNALAGGLQNGRWYFSQEGNITIGEKVLVPQENNEFIKHNTWGITSGYFINLIDESLVTTGTKVTINGLLEADGKLVEYAPSVFQWNGKTWVKLTTLTGLAEGTTVITPEETTENSLDAYQKIIFDRLSLAQTYTSDDGAEKGWDIYLKPSETLTANIDEAYTGLQMTIKNKSSKETFDALFYHAEHDEGTAFVRIGADKIPLDIAEDTEVIIHAGTASSGTTGQQMKLVQDCILQIDADEQWTRPLYDGMKWEIHLSADGSLSGNEGEVFFWPATIGAENTTVEVSKENDDFVIHLTSLQVPTDGTKEVTLKLISGVVTGNQGSVLSLAKDVTLYFNKYGLSKDSPIIPDTQDIGMALMPGSYTTKTNLYLHALKDDAFQVDNTWSVRPSIAGGFISGTYYLEGQAGIYVDDDASDVEFIKHDQFDNPNNLEYAPACNYREYFIGLSGVSDKIEDGAVVTLKGLFIWEGKLVEYLPTCFEWDEETESWSVSMQTSHISGDANGDSTADVRDVVRIKRYLEQAEETNCVIPISPVDADIIMEEQDYMVDSVDLQELRLNLVGAAEIELAAYCGPRRGGYRYYIDNDNDDGSDGNYDGNNNVAAEYGTHPEDPEGGWEGWITEKDFQDYLNCGFTHLLPEQDALYDFTYADGANENTIYPYSDLYPYMKLAEKMNIPVVVHANSLKTITEDADNTLTESDKNFLSQLYRDMSQYKMFKGYFLSDEPSYKSAGSFLATKNYLEALCPGKLFYTACLPMTTSLSLLTDDATLTREEAYNDYMDSYYQATGAFTYDLYPLLTHTTNGNSLEPEWFTNLRLTAEHAKLNQYDAGIVVQSASYGIAKNYRLDNHPQYHRTIESKADVGFQVYTALAYGMKSVNYYSYWTHWNEAARDIDCSAMVNYPINGAEGVKTAAYYAVKAVNQEIKKFDHVFLNFDWKGTMALAPTGAEMSDVLSGALKNGRNYQPENLVATATQETIIGCMEDHIGRDGYMIVNATEPSAGKTSVVTVTLDNATKALAYIEGTETEITLQDGVCELEVGAGEGVFVIPFS